MSEEVEIRAFTVDQVAEMLQISKWAVFDLVRTRKLRSLKLGRRRRFTQEHIDQYLADCEEAA